jgi:hypothetical protein
LNGEFGQRAPTPSKDRSSAITAQGRRAGIRRFAFAPTALKGWSSASLQTNQKETSLSVSEVIEQWFVPGESETTDQRWTVAAVAMSLLSSDDEAMRR